METKVKKEKKKDFVKKLIWAGVSYAAISIIAGICSVLRNSIQGDNGAEISWFVILETVLFPVLFYVAGYLGSKRNDFTRFKAGMFWLLAVGFSAVLMLEWYVTLELYVLSNLPAAEGSLTLDLFLRKITVVQDYAVLYLKETTWYKGMLLPLIHFAFRLIYWLLYALGNRRYALAKKEKEMDKKARMRC